jgi:hypothetical protein
MKWMLIILTIAGGPPARSYRTAGACQRALHHIWISPTREAYCMSVEGDAVFFMRDGKHMAAIR